MRAVPGAPCVDIWWYADTLVDLLRPPGGCPIFLAPQCAKRSSGTLRAGLRSEPGGHRSCAGVCGSAWRVRMVISCLKSVPGASIFDLRILCGRRASKTWPAAAATAQLSPAAWSVLRSVPWNHAVVFHNQAKGYCVQHAVSCHVLRSASPCFKVCMFDRLYRFAKITVYLFCVFALTAVSAMHACATFPNTPADHGASRSCTTPTPTSLCCSSIWTRPISSPCRARRTPAESAYSRPLLCEHLPGPCSSRPHEHRGPEFLTQRRTTSLGCVSSAPRTQVAMNIVCLIRAVEDVFCIHRPRHRALEQARAVSIAHVMQIAGPYLWRRKLLPEGIGSFDINVFQVRLRLSLLLRLSPVSQQQRAAVPGQMSSASGVGVLAAQWLEMCGRALCRHQPPVAACLAQGGCACSPSNAYARLGTCKLETCMRRRLMARRTCYILCHWTTA